MSRVIDDYRNNTFDVLSNTQGFSIEEIEYLEYEDYICIKREGTMSIIVMTIEDEYYIEKIQAVTRKMYNERSAYIIYLIEFFEDKKRFDGLKLQANIVKIGIDVKKNTLEYCSRAECVNIGKFIIDANNKITNNKCNTNIPYITLVLIGINVILYLVCGYMSGDMQEINNSVLYDMGAKYTPSILHGEIWRVVSCMFLHGGFSHISSNMIGLLFLGSEIEKCYSKIEYLMIYFMSGIGSSIISAIVFPEYLGIGASGAIFGLLGAYAVGIISHKNNRNSKSYIYLLICLLLNVYAGFTEANVDVYAHIGGLITGIIVALGFKYIKKK